MKSDTHSWFGRVRSATPTPIRNRMWLTNYYAEGVPLHPLVEKYPLTNVNRADSVVIRAAALQDRTMETAFTVVERFYRFFNDADMANIYAPVISEVDGKRSVDVEKLKAI